jgi:Fe-S-cluster-containing hydrogenase component 2
VVKLVVDNDICTGCQICALTCAFMKEKSTNITKSRIHVNQTDLVHTEISYCTQCGDCVSVCPEEALHVSEKTGAVILNPDLCSACGLCYDACPSGYLLKHPLSGQPLLCDLCHGAPECTENCPTQAIRAEKGEGNID